MLTNALLFLLQTVLGLLTLLFLLRFYFQLTKVSFQNPAAVWVVTLSNFAVRPTRRILGAVNNLGFTKLDAATLLLAFLTQLLLYLLSLALKDFPLVIAANSIWPKLLGLAGLGVINISLSLFLYAVLLQAILSWLNPHTALAPVLSALTAPTLNRLRKFVRPIGQLDISPLVFIISAQLLLTTLLMPLESKLLAAL